MRQASLFKKSKIFLIDEADGIVGREDLGGVGAVIKIIKESRFPVVLTANNPWDQRLRSLRQYCQLVQFKKISVYDIEKRLKEICGKEKIKVDGEVLKQLANISGGDMRSAINDLETVSQGRTKITASDLEILGYRERETNVFEVLRNIFKSKTAFVARQAANKSDKNPEELFWWIENNICNEYEKHEEVAAAFEALSKADIFRQRIMKRQNWRMLAYMIDIMTGGVSAAKNAAYEKFTRYNYPSNIIMLGRSKEGRAAVKEVLKKLSASNHCSIKKFRSEMLPFFKTMMKSSKFKKSFSEAYGISKDDAKILMGM
jgi:replication factor C large subunit